MGKAHKIENNNSSYYDNSIAVPQTKIDKINFFQAKLKK